MTSQQTNGNNTQGKVIILLLYKSKNRIIGFSLLAGICAAIFTAPVFIPPLYKSEVILYPPGTNSNKILIEKDTHFGADKEIDEQIQMLQSGILRDSIIKKYHLLKHYSIDTTVSSKRYKLYEAYSDNVKIDRTRYNSISVTVYDTDPTIAACMANDIVKIGDVVKSHIIQENMRNALSYLEKDYFNKIKEFDAMAEKVNKLVKDNFINNMKIKKQTFLERMKEEVDIRREIAKNVDAKNNYDLKQQYNYEAILGQLTELQFGYEQASSNLNNNIPTCYIISPAEVSYQKTYPIRWLIVLVTFMGSFVLAATCVVAVAKLKGLKDFFKSDATA